MNSRVDAVASDVAARRDRDTTARLAGFGFTVLFVVGFAFLTWTWEDSSVDAEVLDWYADSGNRAGQIIGVFLVAFAGLALIWFLLGLRRRLRATGEDELATAALVAGTVFTTALFAAGAALGAVSAGIEFGDEPLPTNADVPRALAQIGYGAVLVFGALAASLCVLCATRAAHRSGLWSTWLSVSGYVAAVLLLAGFFYLPMVALPIWVLLVAIAGFGPGRPPVSIDLPDAEGRDAGADTPPASKEKRPLTPAHI